MLVIQRGNLETTLSNVGLPRNPSISEVRECFQAKFPAISGELMLIIERMDEVTNELLKTMEVDIKDMDDKKIKSVSDSARWQWRRVKHSLNTKKRNKIIADLRHWNNDLVRALEKCEVPAEDNTKMIEPLPPNFIVSLCEGSRTGHSIRGFLKDPEDESCTTKFSVCNNPTDLTGIVDVVSVSSVVFQCNQAPRRSYPSLSAKERYAIAASIAWSILHLSGSLWMADHWDCTRTHMFIEKPRHGREALSQHPYAACTLSPVAVPEPESANPFRHIVPNQTVFALGLFLIEICTGRRIQDSRQSGNDNAQLSLFDDYQTALKELDEVYRIAGDSYGYATERCIKFAFQGRDQYKDFHFEQFRQQFYDAVVAPVQATYLMFPESRGGM
ncbi:hypothetical protein OQA88_4287 [Cercophora sp. LCS_1]